MKAIKVTKKLLAMMLALIMALAVMSVIAFADGSYYTITIKNAAADTTYSAYKIFDATSSGTAVSYTIPEESEIDDADGFGDVFSTTTNGDKTYVTVKNDVSEEDVISWLKNYVADLEEDAAATQNNINNNSIELQVREQGYYYVTTNSGSTVSITTVTDSATIIDKNDRTPSIGEDGKQVATSEEGSYSSVATMDVGDTAYFKITFTATNYAVDEGESTQITSYTVTDTPSGFSINDSSVAVIVGSNKLDSNKYIANVMDGKLTVTIDWDDEDGNPIYSASETVEVTYTATLTDVNETNISTNKASVMYNDVTLLPVEPGVEVYYYDIVIDKYDGKTNEKLEGAKFVLKNSAGKYYNFTEGAVTWVDNQSEATEMSTDKNGSASFTGLAAGTYTLIETEAPAGYNLLSTGDEINLVAVDDNDFDLNSLTVTKSVANNSGSLLPSTGGMGTTIIYIVGAVLVIGAGIVLVVRRRMSANQ